MRKINFYEELRIIKNFIKDCVKKEGFEQVILGLSGGLDSSVTATLCKLALGENNVRGLIMPYKTSLADSEKHAVMLAKQLGISYEVIDVTPIVDRFIAVVDAAMDNKRIGNLIARVRMAILYDLSAKHNCLVAGTTNKSEFYTGYCTQYGDNACAFEPIMHLYKTEVLGLASLIEIPIEIIVKPASADLWEGQTDEKEMGITYSNLDRILWYLCDEKLDKKNILERGVTPEMYEHVVSMINKSEFKRRLPTSIL